MNDMQPSIRPEFVHCNVCGGDRVQTLYRFDQQSVSSQSTQKLDMASVNTFPLIVKCQDCGLVYVNPRWNYAEGIMPYSEEAEEAYFAATRAKRKVAFDNLIYEIHAKYQMPPFSAIDVGCGDGLMLDVCKQTGDDCEGFEISESLVQRLQIQFGAQKIRFGSLDVISGKTYDIVFLINVIEHLSNPVLTLTQIYNILKPGGLVFIHTPNYGGFPARMMGQRWHQIEPLAHLYYFTQQTLEATLRKVGFQPKENFYLKSDSIIKSTIQRLLDRHHIYIDNGLGVVAQRPRE
jgi:2-polyprenyl-3-methyl-5-hydroxy-6-metoxy-1,4-benzoquinol methylase